MAPENDEGAAAFGDTAPTVEVVVYRHGEVVHRELCESTEAARDVVDRWSELDGVECIVEDLAARHEPGQILQPDIDDLVDEPSEEDEYPQGPVPE